MHAFFMRGTLCSGRGGITVVTLFFVIRVLFSARLWVGGGLID